MDDNAQPPNHLRHLPEDVPALGGPLRSAQGGTQSECPV